MGSGRRRTLAAGLVPCLLAASLATVPGDAAVPGPSPAFEPTHGHAHAGAEAADAESDPQIFVTYAWPKAHVRILVVPPPHGEGAAPPPDPSGRVNLYRAATEAYLEDWAALPRWLAADDPAYAWLEGLRLEWRFLDEAEPAFIAEADIVVTNYERLPWIFILTPTTWLLDPAYALAGEDAPRCVAVNSLGSPSSFHSFADYYNIAAHNLGHCLGIAHATKPHDMMSPEYTHTVGLTTALHCPSNLDGLALASAFGGALGHPEAYAFGLSVPAEAWQRYPTRPGCE